MKTLLAMSTGVLVLSLAAAGCKNQSETMTDKKPSQTFATAEQAARKAKDDLVIVLRGASGLNAGVDAATVEQSVPGKPVRRLDVNFEKLLSTESVVTFDVLGAGERDTIVPLLVGDDVVTVVAVRQDDAGWRVVGSADKGIADDLNTLRRALGDDRDSPITLYEVPNLPARVYAVNRGGAELLFTNYGDRFSLREGVEAASLAPVLRADAVAFQKEYGEALKKERLLR